MANASTQLILVIRQTAARLARQDITYRWSSFGHCNCGHLAQTITGMDPAEIQRRAMRREGDWASQARESQSKRPFPEFDFGDRPALDEGAWEPEDVGACQVTGAPLDEVLTEMYALGLSPDDIGHLERLSDPDVRRRLGNSTKHFTHHVRKNVIAYLHAWADLLEERLESEAERVEHWAEAAE
jgi:hypothetical protein